MRKFALRGQCSRHLRSARDWEEMQSSKGQRKKQWDCSEPIMQTMLVLCSTVYTLPLRDS